MIIAGTGHRPDKLGGYSEHVEYQLFYLARSYLKKHPASRVISGMALGWDTALAHAALHCKYPLTCAIPFVGQENRWTPRSKRQYSKILEKAHQIEVISEGGYESWKLERRNRWMVDNCDMVVALWNGTPGGTANCMAYVEEKHKTYVNLWTVWRDEFSQH
jgi:uncharacterized phage-like protein YoqJ